MSAAEDERIQALAADVDARLVDLWALLWRPNTLTAAVEDDDTRRALAQVLRHAYGQGYQDALQEDAEGRRGALARRHGYRHH